MQETARRGIDHNNRAQPRLTNQLGIGSLTGRKVELDHSRVGGQTVSNLPLAGSMRPQPRLTKRPPGLLSLPQLLICLRPQAPRMSAGIVTQPAEQSAAGHIVVTTASTASGRSSVAGAVMTHHQPARHGSDGTPNPHRDPTHLLPSIDAAARCNPYRHTRQPQSPP